ncbi:MAG TPA: hypothetical protein VIH35_10130, partial [Kiritimatiellia bacterium]
TIEPAVEYGFDFVNITEKKVGKLTGRRVKTGDNEWPYRLYMLRRQSEQIVAGNKKAEWKARLDSFAGDLVEGGHQGMGGRLQDLERDMKDDLLGQVSTEVVERTNDVRLVTPDADTIVIRLPAPATNQVAPPGVEGETP